MDSYFLQLFYTMVQSASFLALVAALLINTLSYCSAEKMYCVTPTITSCSSCPHNSIHCFTLAEYAKEAKLYFTSNTTMVFLPGDHVLDTNIKVTNIYRLSMLGQISSDNTATVVRNGSVGFSFTNIVDFNIYSLAFTSYNKSMSYRQASNSALLLQSTAYAKVVKCSFHDNLGRALTVRNTSITLAENNEFIRNQCRFLLFSTSGCGITALNSHLTFTGNTTFHTNSAVGLIFSGIIWASGSSLNFTGTSNFVDNSVYSAKSGVIYAKKRSTLGFTGISIFNNNSAGAIYSSSDVVLTFNGTNSFINNTAHFGYGVIHAETNTSVSFIGISDFAHNSALGGGAIYADNSVVLTFNGTTRFLHNSAELHGGAIRASHNAVFIFNGISNFFNNSVIRYSGGAISAEANTSLSFSGTSNFTHNWAKFFGGAIDIAENAVLAFNNASNFFKNSAGRCGGAISASHGIVLTFFGNNEFINNYVKRDNGGVIYAANVVLTFNGTSNFFNNSAIYGGAIATDSSSVSFNGTNNFCHNWAMYGGGAFQALIYVVLTFNGVSNFFNNSAKQHHGGVILASRNVVLVFNGTNNFIGNSANSDGGAIIAVFNIALSFNGASNFAHNSAESGGAVAMAYNVKINFNGTNKFISNSANSDGGAIFTAANISLSITGTSSFSSNSALQGGAISANVNSTLTFSGNISFTNNGYNTDTLRDSHGGAMYLAISSTCVILPQTNVFWEDNHANLGGAIYVLNVNPFIYCKVARIARYIPKEECFFQFTGQKLSYSLDAQLDFKNNSADDAGSVLYGGAVDNCKLTGQDPLPSGEVFDMLVHYENDITTSSISSDPFQICPCENNHPNCSKSNMTLFIYPGETFQVSVVAVGQREGIAPVAVGSRMDRGRLLHFQYVQQTTKTCTTLNYTVLSKQDVSIELYPSGPCSTRSNKLLLQLSISQSCPLGFSIDEISCICEPTLQKYTNHCNITNGIGQITRSSDEKFWVGYDKSQRLVLVHPHCPFDFCVSHKVAFPLNSTLSDLQCKHNRSGFLCGHCKDGYSLVLGTSQCRKCNNRHLVLLIPFVIMGIKLVFLLLVCKLTVATGTLNGLVFYANIVGVNRTIFLPAESADVFSVFIAWLNLDFGIEKCFYDGMDAYSKTWLQFVFPVYIWALVVLMILVSHYSQRFANLLGNNPVPVLATLILLSYTKILRTLITVVYFTFLEYPTYSRVVWLHDANIDYIVGKHTPLFLVAMLIILTLFLPYTLLLIFGQWLPAISHLRLFSWVNSARLKPFMDSYHAPYKAKHRYWPGLLLVLRFVLLLVFALNPQQDPSINLLVISLGTALLQLWAWVSGGVYKNWCLDALEGSFALNLIMLCVATFYVNTSGGNQHAIEYTSLSIAFTTFIAILGYHSFQQLSHTKVWKKVPKLNVNLLKKTNTKAAANELNNHMDYPTGSRNLDQLREPWLEDLLQPTHSSF